MRRPLRHVGAAAAATLAVTTVAVPVAAGEIRTQADGDGVPAVRYEGDDRYDTAALIGTDDTSNGAQYDGDAVVLARGDDFPDGLAGTLMARKVGGPVLLTETNSLPATTRDAIDELAPTTVYLLGGPVAISGEVADELEDAGYTVERVAGENRFATAGEIAMEAAADDVDTAIVALGTNFPDALVAGPVSAVGGYPLLLTERDSLPTETMQVLEDLEISTVLLAGGTVAVSDGVEDALEDMGITVQRVAGENRNATATEFADWAVANLGFTDSHVNLATGENFADALSLGAHASMDFSGPAPVLLGRQTELPEDTEMWLRDHASADNSAIHVAGGTVALEDDVVEAARAAFTPAGWTTPMMFAAGMQVDRAAGHLQALQNIATANGGTRASSTPGYDASVAWIKARLDEAGYDTQVQSFDFDYFEETGDPTFARTAGDDPAVTFTESTGPDDSDADYAVMSYSGDATVTDRDIRPIDLAISGNEADSTSGCEAADFPADMGGDIALIQRGACSFAQKAENAFDANAGGVIIFNQGNGGAERTNVFFGTLGGPIDVDGTPGADGPVISTSYTLGKALAQDDTAGTEVRVTIDVHALNEERSSSNLLAETPGGDADNVIMAGAHLDSVPEGPGIQDNGTGSAAVLETALQLARSGAPVENKVRFAWWGAEENGLVGSTHYVDTVLLDDVATAELSPEGEKVSLYLNFDMIGSPNFARFIYDGDGSAFGFGDDASGVIERGFKDFFDSMDLASEETEFSGRSDYAEFQWAGIPTGGLFTGAEGLKTTAQVRRYGGVAGEAYDRCYHQACDTYSNVNFTVFEEMLKAVAHEVYTYAGSTDDVDDARGRDRAATVARPDSSGHGHGDHHHGGDVR